MASGISDYLEAKLLDHCTRVASFTMPAVVAVALYTATPSDTGGGTEVTNAGSYARVDISTAATYWNAAASPGGTASTKADIVFPTSSGAWGTINGIALLDSASYAAGNFLWWGDLTAPKVMASGDVFKILSGSLVLTLG